MWLIQEYQEKSITFLDRHGENDRLGRLVEIISNKIKEAEPQYDVALQNISKWFDEWTLSLSYPLSDNDIISTNLMQNFFGFILPGKVCFVEYEDRSKALVIINNYKDEGYSLCIGFMPIYRMLPYAPYLREMIRSYLIHHFRESKSMSAWSNDIFDKDFEQWSKSREGTVLLRSIVDPEKEQGYKGDSIISVITKYIARYEQYIGKLPDVNYGYKELIFKKDIYGTLIFKNNIHGHDSNVCCSFSTEDALRAGITYCESTIAEL